MKKVMIIILATVLFFQFSSALCTLTPSLINQDPVSAVPGETVKVLLQLEGTENPECGIINLEFLEEYPFTLDSGYSRIQTIQGGTYQRDFNSFWMIPYRIRVDSSALDGNQKFSIRTWVNSDSQLAKVSDFNISVEEVRTDFVVTLDSYSYTTNKLVLGILNVGEKTAQATTVKIPKQDNIKVEGGSVKILGEVDSNEDTTVTFDGVPSSGPIIVEIEYNDEINERRFLTKEVVFNGLDFESTKIKSSISIGSIILWIIIVGIVVYLYLSRRKAHLHIKHLSRNTLKQNYS